MKQKRPGSSSSTAKPDTLSTTASASLSPMGTPPHPSILRGAATHIDPGSSRFSLESSLLASRSKPTVAFADQAGLGRSDSMNSLSSADRDRLSLDMNRVPLSTLDVLCRICEKKVAANWIQDHTPICAAVEAACGEDTPAAMLGKLAAALESGRITSLAALSHTDRVDIKCIVDACREAGLLPSDDARARRSAHRAEALLGKVEAIVRRFAAKPPTKKMSRFRPADEGRSSSSPNLAPNSDRGILVLSTVLPKALELLRLRAQELALVEGLRSARVSASMTPVSSATSSVRRTTIDDFEIIKPISRGAHGRVYLARKKTTGDVFAIKVLRKGDLIRKNLIDNVKKERDILSSTDNPFVVRLFYS